MRVTIDLDDHDKQKLRWVCRKGKKICGKRPDEIWRTRHGYHVIFRELPISEERSFEIRKILGDDLNRQKIDLQGNRIKQVLFSQKVFRVYDFPDNIDGDRTLRKIESFQRVKIR